MSSQRVVSGLRSEQFIHTDPDVAWEAWTDKAVLVKWFPGVTDLSKVSDGEITAGSKVVIKGAAEAEIEILEFGIKIIISQSGKIPKLAQIYMFSNVKYS